MIGAPGLGDSSRGGWWEAWRTELPMRGPANTRYMAGGGRCVSGPGRRGNARVPGVAGRTEEHEEGGDAGENDTEGGLPGGDVARPPRKGAENDHNHCE